MSNDTPVAAKAANEKPAAVPEPNESHYHSKKDRVFVRGFAHAQRCIQVFHKKLARS